MKNRFSVNSPLERGSLVTLGDEELHHAVRVLRIREGEEVEVFNERGESARGVVRSATRETCAIEVGERMASRESPLQLTLALALIQPEKFEWAIQKCVEIGVASIVPLIADRCEIRRERVESKRDRWEKIILEAVKQSGRSAIPRLAVFAPLEQLNGPVLFFDADSPAGEAPSSLASATLAIGPEGGWSEREIALANERGFVVSRLGPRRLRAETAAVVASAVTMSRYGDVR